MTEFIVRLTDEQEAFIRNSSTMRLQHSDLIEACLLRDGVMAQIKAALTLYDELVAEAKAKSDD